LRPDLSGLQEKRAILMGIYRADVNELYIIAASINHDFANIFTGIYYMYVKYNRNTAH
jgi:hypothetical protein